ncbi:MAG: ELM1/GtrOC1 family putative glycosyltransferase [Candidatus Omnitrophota bacterium]
MMVKKNSLIEYFLYLTAKALTFIIRFIPLGFSIFLGRIMGALAFHIFIKKRTVAYKNLKIAFPSYSCKKISRIIKDTFMNCAQHIIELLYLPWMDEKYFNKYIEFVGLDKILELAKNKKGTIVLGLHEGSWEVGSLALAQVLKEFNHTIVARTQRDIPLLDNLLNQYRTGKHCNIITIADNFRPVIDHLKKGFSLGMVADHGAQGGIFVDFFGRPALTPIGGVKLALKLDTNLVTGFIKRKSLTQHKIYLKDFQLARTGDLDKDIKINLENINRRFEEYIRKDPGEYLWFFKRWKHSPQRNILVLSDGKLGHFKQSLAVLDLIKSLPFQVNSETVEIKFKNRFQKALFNICSFFFSKKCQSCMRCLRILFGKEESPKLFSNYYDIVISCGSGLAMINRLVAFDNSAKSIVVMKPGIFSLKRFDLAIIPEHDRAPKFENVVSIKGALSSKVNKENGDVQKIIKDYNLNNPSLSHPIIGLLLGGENRYLSLDVNIVKDITDSLDRVIQELGGTILISTSRRTSRGIEEFLKTSLSNKDGYRMLIIANESNPKGAFDTILHLSDILVVTGDSISMISETINSRKYTIVYKLKRKSLRAKSKYEKFIEDLERERYVFTYKDNLFNNINEIWQKKPVLKELSNNELILKRLEKIL